ncbi:MAG: SDR family NAD(P)-dependent oxidoreductase [Gemmatimonadota bacterium]|nr:SDR family NAD(P)-dependent oxidoreductase [Gemmatimonadota bacterium]MDE2870304.1 SDR family NAD(P)-dependent oxidoreductase [Gemmatimonadota bacterium]
MGDTRVALVTGATGGIGAAVARRLAADGFVVYAGGRRRRRLGLLAGELNGVALPFDVTVEEEVAGARAVVETGDGRIDVLVNAAGVFDLAPVVETRGEVLGRNLGVNLAGVVNVTRAFLPGMLAAGSGLVVNVGSVAGWRAFPENAAYSASKYGLRGFHDVLLEELQGTGVRACLLEPGAVDTAIWDPLDPDSAPHLPDRARMLRPEDVARAAGFVAGLPDSVAVPLLRIERA